MRFLLALLLLILLNGCALHRQRKMEREWQSIWEQWQIESEDDCNYISSFARTDCLKRHNQKL